MGFPQLIDEDFNSIDRAMQDLMAKSEAEHVMLVEKAGHLIQQKGGQDQYPPDVLATLASNSFNAVQFMAGLLNEDKFPGMYQQGERFSTLMLNVDEHCMLVIIFKAHLSVGAVRFYANSTIKAIAAQIKTAEVRDSRMSFDLTDLNVTDVGALFRRQDGETTPVPEPAIEAPPPAPVAPAAPVTAPEVPTEAPPVIAEAVSPPVDTPPASTEKAEALMPQDGPYLEAMMPGNYHWCACGRAVSQPFCDGAHAGTGWSPVPVEITSIRRIAWCGCKKTKNPPFCDGTHAG